MRKFNLRQVVRRMGVIAALGLTTLVTSTPAAVGQTILINPLLEGGFELGPSFAANGWTVVNGSGVTNQWYVGTVPSGFTNNAAYISADAGATNGYTNSSSSVVHFYRDVTFPAGETAIALNFNWKALGETGYYDALIVSVAPTSYTPTASTTSLSTNSLAAPAVEIGRLWSSSTTQSAYLNIPASVAGNCSGASTMRLIFTWKNDGSGGTAPSGAIDNIALGSSPNPITSLGGTYTIDNTLPQSATNFPSFSAAIVALNGAYSCGAFTGPVLFNVTAGQTFNELPPAITASGNATATITFQKSGGGSNPVITSLQSVNVNDASIAILGGDYFTFDGIDLNASANANLEYGYLIRNASATDGAKNNTIKNSTIQLNRTGTINTSSSGVMISATATANGFTVTNATGSNDNNLLQNITVNGAINGISILGTSGFADLNNAVSTTAGIRNTVTNIGPVGSTSMVSRGIHLSNQSGATVQNSDISNVTSYTSTAQGIFLTGAVGNSTITRNSVYAVSNQGSTSTTSVAYGIQAQNSTTGTNNIRISNNMIGNIFTSFTGTATATRYAIGIHTGVASATSSQSYDVYNNTVSIGSGLTPTYSNACYEIQNVAAIYRVQNNIFANFTGAQGATARHYAWVTTSATNFGAAGSVSNYNDLYISTDAGTSGFVARANTTNLATIANWTAAITAIPGTDLNSINAAPTFVNNNSNLHLNFGVTPTQIESSGNNALGITIDFDGDNRPGPAGSVNGGGTAPDMGADEFDGAPLSAPTVTLNSVTPPATAQCTAAPRLVSVNVANTSGTVTSVSLGYTVNGVAQTPIAMVNTSGTTWEATIPVPTPSNATIAWGVSATNSFALTGNYIGTSYSDEPTTGVTLTASVAPGTICAGTNTTLTAKATKNGVAIIGTATNLTGATSQPTAFCNRWSSYRMQTVFTAAELTAAGLSAGPITSIGYTITTLGDGATNANFTVKVGTTALSTLTDFVSSAGFTTTYPAATYTHAIGLNTITFSTPFAWDGTSNIIIEVSHDGANLTNNAQTYYTTTAGNTVAWSTNGGATGTLSTQRLNIAIGGVLNVPISSISWSDGVGTVGTTNPLIVAPTANTTYTATASALGCPIGTANTSVTVNPLPSAPTVSNSSQCGTQVPTASVTSTSGLPTPTFIWYDAAVAGTALQTSTSTTYTSNVATTTTFYVSELNTVTGCESARTAVTVTVAAADGISASASATTICIGNSVTLTAANTNPTPNQSYTYTWSGVANSGANPSVNGASVTVTPTQPGTYQYDLSGADGGCNAVANVSVTVDPFTATVAPINITCNGYNNGSFSLSGSSCGTTPYSYSVDGGSFALTIPTNLTPGVHSVVVQDANGYLASSQNITITEPSTTISAPSGTGATVCQNGTSAQVSATSNTSVPTPQSTVVNFALAAQPTETQAAPGVTISSAALPVLPAGAVITGLTLACNGIVPHGGEYQSDVRLGLSGAFTNTAAQGTGTIGSGTVAEAPYNYTRAIPVAGFPTTGGTLDVVYWNNWNDVSGGDDATFPLGASAITLTINYTVPTPATITWWDASTGGTQVGTGSPLETVGTSVLPTTATPGTYTFYAQGEYGGCNGVTRTAVTVTVNALPSVNAGTDQTVCSGTSVTLSGSGATSYSWDNGVTNGTPFSASATTTYTVTGTDGNGCQNTDQVLVTVNALPTVNAGSDVAVCDGASATLTASGTATGYSWDNGVTDGVAFTPSATTTYTVTGTDGNGCQNTDAVTVTVNALPSVNAGVDQAICDGSSITLNGSGATSYAWDNGVTDGVAFTPSATTTYTVTGTDGNGCVNTDAITVTVNTLPTVTANATSTTLCAGDAVTLTGSGATSYSWDNGATDGVAINPSATTTYTVTGTDGNGCQNTDAVTVTVNTLPTVNAGSDVAVCDGASATLTASGTATGYSWDNGVTDGVAFTPSATTTYTVTGTDGNGCQNTDAVTVTVNALPSVDAGVDQAVCDGSSITLNGSGATSYAWDNGVTDGVAFTPSATTTYTLTGTDGNGCQNTDAITVTVNTLPTVTANATSTTLCAGDAVTLTGSGASSYSWDNGATDGVAINPSATTTYTVTGTDGNGCQNTDAITVTVNALPNVTANATSNSICEGDAVTLTGSGASSYSWDNGVTDGVAINPTATTTYTVTGTDGNGCENTDAVTVTVNTLPTATATDNGDATITASAGASYQWIDCATGQAIAGATSQTYTATANGDYAVVVTNASNCSDTSSCVTIDYIGLKEITDASIRVFPNPTNNDVFVTMGAVEATVEVSDAQGKLLQTTVVKNGEKVSLGTYETGVYFLRIRTANGSTLERIVKQ